jgi:hypothetical protein
VPNSRRALGATVAVVAVVLTTVGVALAATDPNPTGASDRSLALHGRVPRTAQLSFEADTGQGLDVTGIAGIDFRRQRAELSVSIPAVVSELIVTVVVADDHIYLTTQNLQTVARRPWVGAAYPTPDFARLAQIAADFRPEVTELSRLGPVSVRHHDPYTTYRVTKTGTIRIPGAPSDVPSSGTITIAVTTASEHQVSALDVAARHGRSHASAHIDVLAYNAPVHVGVPPPGRVRELAPSTVAELIAGRLSILELLSPDGLAKLPPASGA